MVIKIILSGGVKNMKKLRVGGWNTHTQKNPNFNLGIKMNREEKKKNEKLNLVVFMVNICLNVPFKMSFRAGLPPPICSQIQQD